MKQIIKSFKEEFTTAAVVTIPLCVAINYISGTIAGVLKLPIFLDTIGTLFACMVFGPLVGIITGMLSSIVSSITMPTMLPFIVVNIALALCAGILAKHKMFSNYMKIFISSIIMAIVSIIIAAPVVVIVFSGFTGGGSSMIAGLITASGVNIWISVFSAEGFFTWADRILTIIICLSVIKCLPNKLLLLFPLGSLYLKNSDSE